MQFVDIAQEIIDESSELVSTNIPSITSWLRNNIGKLNAIINTTYEIDETTLELSTPLTEEQKAIFKLIYVVDFYRKKIEQNLGSMAYDSVLELTSDGGSIKKINRNEIAKTYLQLKKEATIDLRNLVNRYKLMSFNNDPKAVHGTDGDVTVVNNYPEYYVRARKVI